MTNDTETRVEIEEAAAIWIAKRGSGNWTQADATALDVWLAASAGHRVAYYRLNDVWGRTARLERAPPVSSYRYCAVAASVILLVGATAVGVNRGFFRPDPELMQRDVTQSVAVPGPQSPAAAADPEASSSGPAASSAVPAAARLVPQRFTTAIGESRSIVLVDGSRVTLDTDSRIRVILDEHLRTVQLERGQAFFEVSTDLRRPFAVTLGSLRVVAVGTAFSVRSVGSDVRIVVSEGSVRLEQPTERIEVLASGGIAQVETRGVRIHQAQPGEVERNLSWRNGVLTFRHTPLSKAVAEFNRYGSRQIVIQDPRLASLEIGGVFASGDAEGFVRLLERTLAVEALILPGRIELNARSSP